MSTLLKPSKRADESEFEVFTGSRRTKKGFLMTVLYWSDISEANDVRTFWYGAERQQHCVRSEGS